MSKISIQTAALEPYVKYLLISLRHNEGIHHLVILELFKVFLCKFQNYFFHIYFVKSHLKWDGKLQLQQMQEKRTIDSAISPRGAVPSGRGYWPCWRWLPSPAAETRRQRDLLPPPAWEESWKWEQDRETGHAAETGAEENKLNKRASLTVPESQQHRQGLHCPIHPAGGAHTSYDHSSLEEAKRTRRSENKNQRATGSQTDETLNKDKFKETVIVIRVF